MLEPKVIRGLIGGAWRDLEFEPFRPGITIHWLLTGEPAVALLSYEPGAKAPLHLHQDVETILMIDGSQSDERGTYRAGDYVINPKDSQHSVWSGEGCVALLHWSKPVRFLEDQQN